MTDFVLDNSVAMRWCFNSGANPYADAVLQQLNAEGQAFVPLLRRYEVSAVLARAEISGVITTIKVTNFLDNIGALAIIIDLSGGNRILREVRQLAVDYRLTSYDAAYLELALRKNLPLASLDAALRQACLSAGGTLL